MIIVTCLFNRNLLWDTYFNFHENYMIFSNFESSTIKRRYILQKFHTFYFNLFLQKVVAYDLKLQISVFRSVMLKTQRGSALHRWSEHVIKLPIEEHLKHSKIFENNRLSMKKYIGNVFCDVGNKLGGY